MIKKFKIVHQPDKSLEEKLPQGLEGIVTQPIVTLAGPNGSGKSAFLRMLMSSYEHFFREVKLKSDAKQLGKTGLLGMKRARDYFTSEGEVNKAVVSAYPPRESRLDYNDEFDDSAKLLQGVNLYYDRQVTKANLEPFFNDHVLLTESAIDNLMLYGEEGMKWCSFTRSEQYGAEGPNKYWPKLPYFSVQKVEKIRKELQALQIPKTLPEKWKYVALEALNPRFMFAIGFTIKKHPFYRSGNMNSTKLDLEKKYYDFEEEVYSYTGKANSSGQRTQEEFTYLYKTINEFFENGSYPLGFTNEFDRELRENETRKVPPNQQSRSSLVVCMDEPTTAMDYRARKQFAKRIDDLTRQYSGRLQFWIATHASELIELPNSSCLNFYQSPAHMQSTPLVD